MATSMASTAAASASRTSMPRIIIPSIARVIAGHYQTAAAQSASSSASSSAGPSSIRIPNPFLPSRSSTSRWRPPAISLRRQADLAKLLPAAMTVLPPGPKTPVSAGYAQSTLLEAEPGSAEDSLRVEWIGEIKDKIAKVGPGKPYGMRKKFKGHKFEREKRVRMVDVGERLEGMDKRIEEWRKAKKDAKSTAKPSLPY